jgi:hypothetical protein
VTPEQRNIGAHPSVVPLSGLAAVRLRRRQLGKQLQLRDTVSEALRPMRRTAMQWLALGSAGAPTARSTNMLGVIPQHRLT